MQGYACTGKGAKIAHGGNLHLEVRPYAYASVIQRPYTPSPTALERNGHKQNSRSVSEKAKKKRNKITNDVTLCWDSSDCH
jgi:hypothetical protein